MQSLKHIQQALNFVWQSSRRLTIAQIVLLLFQSILPLVNIYILKLLIDEIERQAKQGAMSSEGILFYIILMGGIMLLASLIGILTSYVGTAQSQKVSDYMSSMLEAKSVEIDLQYYEDPQYHDTLHRAQTQGLYRPVHIMSSLFSVLQNGLSIAAIATLFVLLHWGIAVIFILTTLPAFFIKVYFSKALYDWEKETTQMERESYYLNRLLTDEHYVKEIRVFDVAGVFMKKFKKLRERLFKEKMSIEGKRSRAEVFAKTAEITATVSIYGFVAFRAASGSITVGDFVMYFQAFQKGQSSLKSMLTSLASLYENRLFLKYIFDFLQITPKVRNLPNAQPIPKIEQSITFQNVHFAYPSSKEGTEVLKRINLEMNKGEVIAIVGENGSGKTTLIKLLSRLYDVTKGQIAFDNQDIRTLNLNQVRQKIGIIFQDYSKYHLSVQDNIQIADMHETLHSDRIAWAAQSTGADKFIEELPEKYQNMLGLRFRKGAELSGGQWQKVALSRAFYKDADIIVLDEPTSAIDPLAEYDIFEKFKEISRDKILILITHRLYNLKMADKIVVMDKGEIVEMGTHLELSQLKGKYFKMFEKQME